jgi:lipopolysaccharide export system permease protein
MSAEFKQKITARSDASQVAPGSFKEASSTDRVVFVETVGEDETHVRNVFISAVQHGKLGVTMASRGYQETAENGDLFMVLEKGRRYEVVPGTPEFRIMEFDKYALRVETKEDRGATQTVASETSLDLWRSDSRYAHAELLWRINVPVSAIVLALLAIPLSFVNPRAGRANNMLVALLVYLLYSNAISVFQSWVAQGKLGFVAGLLLPHLAVLAALALMFHKRLAVSPFWRRRA